MSKYTTEVRYICEFESGLSESKGFNDVDEILDKSWNKIFTTKCEIFDEDYREILCKKILKHYYLREIGCETVSIWKLWINTRLAEILPYYNQLYKSATLQFNPFYDTEYESEQTRDIKGGTNSSTDEWIDHVLDGTENINNKETINENFNKDGHITQTGNIKHGKETKDAYSDTPQGSLTEVENYKYLTNYRYIDDTTTDSFNDKKDTTHDEGESSKSTDSNQLKKVDNKEKGHKSGSNNGSNYTIDKFTEKVLGKRGSQSYSSLLTEYRETFLNIDMMIINDMEDLFMYLW